MPGLTRLLVANGDPSESVTTAASTVAPNHPNVLRWRALRALQAGEHAKGIEVLVQMVDKRESVDAARLLARIATDREGITLLRPHLPDAERWLPAVLAQFPSLSLPAGAALPLVAAALEAGSLPDDARRSYMRFLKGSGQWLDAYGLWLVYQKEVVPLLYNAGFDQPLEADGFDWEFTPVARSRAGVTVSQSMVARRGLVLELEFTGRRFTPSILRQHVFAPPGTYRLAGEYASKLRSEAGLVWSIGCGTGDKNLVGSSPPLLETGGSLEEIPDGVHGACAMRPGRDASIGSGGGFRGRRGFAGPGFTRRIQPRANHAVRGIFTYVWKRACYSDSSSQSFESTPWSRKTASRCRSSFHWCFRFRANAPRDRVERKRRRHGDAGRHRHGRDSRHRDPERNADRDDHRRLGHPQFQQRLHGRSPVRPWRDGAPEHELPATRRRRATHRAGGGRAPVPALSLAGAGHRAGRCGRHRGGRVPPDHRRRPAAQRSVTSGAGQTPAIAGPMGPAAFYALLSLLVAAPLMRGGNRNVALIVLEGVAPVFPVALLARMPRPAARLSVTGWLLAFLLSSPAWLAVIYLLPLPPGLWEAVPGRADYVGLLAGIGIAPGQWRPLSLVPNATSVSLLAGIPIVAGFAAAYPPTCASCNGSCASWSASPSRRSSWGCSSLRAGRVRPFTSAAPGPARGPSAPSPTRTTSRTTWAWRWPPTSGWPGCT
ncbi:hypothetical protein HK414_05575 [Ramlibacter terrae]|uniref:HEAT repeat domain-containing protein n=1 Tax=Ramlibacter terrae TaxID=2732511 RepID=A0ABX6P279_9BURK|nr:hypothetical protein HK414_05575 [Ramlibacter terrae]